MVAFKLPPAMEAIEREIADILKSKPNEPPDMIEVPINDSRLRNAHRAHPTLVAKRK